VGACVCVSRVYVRAYLTIPCVSANDNVKHTKLKLDEKKVKCIRINVYEYTERIKVVFFTVGALVSSALHF